MKKVFLTLALIAFTTVGFSQGDPVPPSLDSPGSDRDCFTECNTSTYFDCVLKYYSGSTLIGQRTCKFRAPRL